MIDTWETTSTLWSQASLERERESRSRFPASGRRVLRACRRRRRSHRRLFPLCPFSSFVLTRLALPKLWWYPHPEAFPLWINRHQRWFGLLVWRRSRVEAQSCGGGSYFPGEGGYQSSVVAGSCLRGVEVHSDPLTPSQFPGGGGSEKSILAGLSSGCEGSLLPCTAFFCFVITALGSVLLALGGPWGVRSVCDGGALVGGRWKLSVGGLSGAENSGVVWWIVWSFAGGSEKSFGASRMREEMSIHFRSILSPDERRSFSVVVVGDAGAGMWCIRRGAILATASLSGGGVFAGGESRRLRG